MHIGGKKWGKRAGIRHRNMSRGTLRVGSL